MPLPYLPVHAQRETDDGYKTLESLIRERISQAKGPFFRTDAKDLFQTYLENLPGEKRQHYNCRACQKFIDNYGGLVTIDYNGQHRSLLFNSDGVPEFFYGAINVMDVVVLRAKVTGVFLPRETVWGTPQTGNWTHLSGVCGVHYPNNLYTQNQLEAAKVEEYGMLQRSLAEFPAETVRQAVRVLEADALDRSEKTLGAAKWLLNLHESLKGVKIKYQRENLVWLAVATAPVGFCHVRTSMIGTLLEDLQSGMEFEAVKRRWAAKMHPLQYQRPTTINDGAIKRAEEIFNKLGLAPALNRRFAKLEDLKLLWQPTVPLAEEVKGGLFGRLKKKPVQQPAVEIPEKKITWVKFRDAVLTTAEEVQCYISRYRDAFVGLVTAVDQNAPPILQWDTEPRNPVSWYFYHGGSSPDRWGLVSGTWHSVTGICLKPPHWHYPLLFSREENDVFFVLEGARDTEYVTGALFFPECLRTELHPVRKVMERYAQTGALSGRDEGTANGLGLSRKGRVVRVKSQGGWARYRIDRWD